MNKLSIFFAYLLATSLSLQGSALPSLEECNDKNGECNNHSPLPLLCCAAGIKVGHLLHNQVPSGEGNYFDQFREIGSFTLKISAAAGALAIYEASRSSLPKDVYEPIDCAVFGMAARLSYPIITNLFGWISKK